MKALPTDPISLLRPIIPLQNIIFIANRKQQKESHERVTNDKLYTS